MRIGAPAGFGSVAVRRKLALEREKRGRPASWGSDRRTDGLLTTDFVVLAHFVANLVRLVLRFSSRFYPWKNAHPLLDRPSVEAQASWFDIAASRL